MSEEVLRAAIRLTIDSIEQLQNQPSSRWSRLVQCLIKNLRALRLHDPSVLWALLSVATEQIEERRRALLDMNGPTLRVSAMPVDVNAEGVLESFERDIAALMASVGSSDRATRVSRVMQYVQQHYHEPLSLEFLAYNTGGHKARLAYEFKQQTGLTLHYYITQVRVQRAAELLRTDENDTKIEALMVEVGYRSKKNFYRQFKGCFGVTPGMYRERFGRAR